MSAVPPNDGVDADRPVQHRGTGAHDEDNFRRLSNMVEAGKPAHAMVAMRSYQPGSVDAANFLLACALSGLASGTRERHE
jgi:hypothetical protein